MQKNMNFLLNNASPKQVFSSPTSLLKSIQGNYFVGQTGELFVKNDLFAWAGLVNPSKSTVNLYTNVFTISNYSNDYLTAEIWLNPNFPKSAHISHKVSPTNTSLIKTPQNKVNIKFIESTTLSPKNGVNIYERIVPPNTTLVGEEDGKFIESPGGNYTIILKSKAQMIQKVIVAFGWWEKSICSNLYRYN